VHKTCGRRTGVCRSLKSAWNTCVSQSTASGVRVCVKIPRGRWHRCITIMSWTFLDPQPSPWRLLDGASRHGPRCQQSHQRHGPPLYDDVNKPTATDNSRFRSCWNEFKSLGYLAYHSASKSTAAAVERDGVVQQAGLCSVNSWCRWCRQRWLIIILIIIIKVNIYIAHYHFEEIFSALNALSVHLKQKWFKETFKRVQIECVIIQVHWETVPSWWASERECPSASCCKSVTRNGKLSTASRTQMTTARQRWDRLIVCYRLFEFS